MLIGNLSLLTAAAFAGAAFYVGFVEQPARLQLADGPLLAEWKPSYKRGALMQASIAMISGALGLAAWWSSGDWRFALGAVLMLASWPYTFAVMMPTNHALEATPVEQASAASRALIETMGPAAHGQDDMRRGWNARLSMGARADRGRRQRRRRELTSRHRFGELSWSAWRWRPSANGRPLP